MANAGELNIQITETILITQRSSNKVLNIKANTQIGDSEAQYNSKISRWFGVWLDMILTLNDQCKTIFIKAMDATDELDCQH